jgi:ketosteroid isomerase-like protein
MKGIPAVVGTAMLATLLLSAGQGVSPKAAAQDRLQADRAAIERLHEQDRAATLSDSADQLAKLWDKDAVRFSSGRPAEIGAAVIYANDKRWEMSSGRERSLCFDIEIQDLQIAGDWAIEWWYGSYKTSKGGKVSIGYGKGVRVMKRQPDGTWRFARVISLTDPPASGASGVVLKHPCQ